ncbi:MAG: hypothetical protein AB8B65_07275 [Kordia sp.]|uniref:hypothetical protein n=1 Tax=Kordia sp. TaxID=1965332 RepID=UPI00385A3918
MNVMTEQNRDKVTEKIIPIELLEQGNIFKHLVPAPITPKTIRVSKDKTEVSIPVTLYLEAEFSASSISHCLEIIVFEDPNSDKAKEIRIVNIAYDYDVKENSVYKPHVYNVKLSNFDVTLEEMQVTFFLTNVDPETSRGTTTTVKREM